MKLQLIVLFVCFAYMPTSLGSPSGAPREACNDMLPGHFSEPQTGPCPYTITAVRDSSSGLFIVTIAKDLSSQPPFRGFLVQARDQTTQAKVGAFESPSTGSQLLTCDNDGDSVTHVDRSNKNAMTLYWRPPPGSLAGIKFTLTVVQQFSIFWTFQLSDDLGSVPVV